MNIDRDVEMQASGAIKLVKKDAMPLPVHVLTLILERQSLQELRNIAQKLAQIESNVNPQWARAYLAMADAADWLDALHARAYFDHQVKQPKQV